MNNLVSLLLIGFICNLVHSEIISTIRGTNPCQYIASDGSFYNLQDLVLLNGSYSITNKLYSYDINICDYQTEINCNGVKTAVCQSYADLKYPVASCGLPTKTHFADGLLGPAHGVSMTYFGGDICVDTGKPRISMISLVCDPSTNIRFTGGTESQICQYSFLIFSKFACPIDNIKNQKKI